MNQTVLKGTASVRYYTKWWRLKYHQSSIANLFYKLSDSLQVWWWCLAFCHAYALIWYFLWGCWSILEKKNSYNKKIRSVWLNICVKRSESVYDLIMIPKCPLLHWTRWKKCKLFLVLYHFTQGNNTLISRIWVINMFF